MAPMSRNFFVLFLLCVVLLIVVGVAFPSYISRKKIKLESTFNSSVVSFTTLFSEKLISESSKAGNITNTTEITFMNPSNVETMKINISNSTADSLMNVKKRSKRQMLSDKGSDLFDWNVNINVTRYKKVDKVNSDDSNTVKRSGVAIYLESKEPKEIAFSEMQSAFNSIKSFFRDFFKVDFKDATDDSNEKKKVLYFTESPWEVKDHTTIDSFEDTTKALTKQQYTEEDDSSRPFQPSEHTFSEENENFKLDGGNNSSNQTDRGARIFFGLFNLGGKSLRKTTPEPETTLADDMDKFSINESLPDMLPHEAVFGTANSQEVQSLYANLSRFETEKSIIEQVEQKSEKSDMLSVTFQGNCLGCDTVKTENPNLSNEQDSKTTLVTTSKPDDHLTDKTLRNLCMQILSNLESQTPVNEGEQTSENQLGSPQNLQIDSLNSLISNENQDLNTSIEIDDNFFISSEESLTESGTLLGKQARFLSIFGLGSGRSEIINEGNLIFEKEPDEPEFTNLPSVSDCEKFNKIWKMEVVPKLDLDLNTTPSEFIFYDNQKQDNGSMLVRIDANENETVFRTEISLDTNKDMREAKNEKANTEENGSLNELVESVTDSEQNVKDTIDGQRDGRFFSFFGFGSGNGRDEKPTDSGRFLGIFGSGMRSLDSNEFDESNDLGSGIPFAGNVFGEEGDPSQKDTTEYITPAQDGRFLGAFGVGSGEGRDMSHIDSITEYDDHIDCENDCSHGVPEQPYDCNDCDYDFDVANISAEFSQTNNSKEDCEGNCTSSIVEIRKIIAISTSESIDLDSSLNPEGFLLTKDLENSENPYDDHDSRIPSRTDKGYSDLDYHSTDNYQYEQNTESSIIEQVTTEKKNRRFMGTIFLTGSGDGGLFGDDGGPINLVEEENTVGSSRNPRRRGRLDDADNFGQPQNPSDIFENPDSSESNTQDLVPVTDRPNDNSVTDKSGKDDLSSITFLPPPNITLIQIQSRSCSGARDCNHTLNERCITVSGSSVCDCGRSFVRHKETGKCVAKWLVETSLKLPEVPFEEDLRNPFSPRYKEMSEKSLETIYLLLQETPNILRVVTDVNVAGFESGSLIVKLNFVLAAEKDHPSQNIKNMEKELQKALREDNVLKRATLNVKDASFQPLKSEINRCKSPELNYCSKYAHCMWNEDFPGGFICKCKEHYLDVSTNSFYPGEICVAKCPATFCGTNGHCEILGNNEKHCVCYGLYFGERCEYPGIVILGSLSIVALISLIILFVVILKLRCRSRYGSSPTFRRADTPGHAIANCRLSDAIALGESRGMKVSKLTQISTPVQELPAIKITRPTLNESSISFECDSTFDVSNNTDEKSV